MGGKMLQNVRYALCSKLLIIKVLQTDITKQSATDWYQAPPPSNENIRVLKLKRGGGV